MRWLAIDSPARSAQEPAMSEGMTRLLPLVESYGFFNFVETEKCRTPSMRGCGWESLAGRIGGVDSVHTLGLGLGRTVAGLGRIAEVSAGVQCLQGLESGSSPTSGTVFSLFRGLLVFLRVHIVHTPASDLMFRVCEVPDRPIRLFGGAASYGGPLLWGLCREFMFVRPSVGFRVHLFMVARAACNMIC